MPERPLQHSFIKSWFISALLIFGLVVGLHRPLRTMADRVPRPPVSVAMTFTAVPLRGSGPFMPVGAWELRADDPRLDGVSALVREGEEFLAITDSGVAIRFPRPGTASPVMRLSDLPSGPGVPMRKAGNDAEAMARDPAGRGWWVAFESVHQLRLFDDRLTRTLAVVPLDGRRWTDNGGVEGMAAVPGGVLLFAEEGDMVQRFDGRELASWRIDPPGRLGDAARLPDGRILLLLRRLSPLGFSNGVALYDPARGTTLFLGRLTFGHLDNAEGLAVEPMPGGFVRLWVITDRDSRARGRTLLAAYHWKVRP